MTTNNNLFRPEALNAQRGQWLGTVVLASKPAFKFYALFALLSIVAVSLLLGVGQFSRKVKVNGWLVPQGGMVKIFAQQPGVVGELKVKDGSLVAKGDPLIVLSAERKSSGIGSTQVEIIRLLNLRKNSIESEMRQQQVLLNQQTAAMARRIDAIRGETEQFSREIALQSSRTDLASKSVERIRTLADSGFTSVTQLHQQQEQELDQRSKLRVLERTRAERQRELVTLKAEMDDLPLKNQTQLSNYSRELKVLDQELAESEARREIVIPAPQSGTVTGVQAEVGGSATVSTPLLSIVPQGSQLEAHLFAPSKAVGFILPGQKVLLRYQSFPYQKFGHYQGVVQSVSGSAISPAELPTQMSGLSSLVGTNEPIYRIIVRLDRQSVLAYGQNQALQPGMQLDSDIMLEKRKLWEWMLEPLFTLTGRL